MILAEPSPSRRMSPARFRILIATGVLALLAGAACRPLAPPRQAEAPETQEITGKFPPWPLPDGRPLRPPRGRWSWRWQTDRGSGGRAELQVGSGGWRWRLVPPPPPGRRLILAPDDSLAWHSLVVPAAARGPLAWRPLARRAVRSPFYADLLDLLADLAGAAGDSIVRHWPRYPVTVGSGPAVSGSVDLAACLAAGVAWWNTRLPGLFRWLGEPGGDVRLVHIPGHQLHPPLSVHVLQRDATGRPLRMTIRAGDTYDAPHDERYARRGLLHELSHVIGLWGHSPDRRHILWRAGPVVDVPDSDEVLAVRWWLSLPEGLDLARHGRRGEMAP